MKASLSAGFAASMSNSSSHSFTVDTVLNNLENPPGVYNSITYDAYLLQTGPDYLEKLKAGIEEAYNKGSGKVKEANKYMLDSVLFKNGNPWRLTHVVHESYPRASESIDGPAKLV